MPQLNVIKAFGVICALGIGSELLYQLFVFLKRKQKRKSGNDLSELSLCNVLFFPDRFVACKKHFLAENGCQNDSCRFSHSKNSLSELFCYLNRAKTSLEVCVFTISCQDLADIIVSKAKQGVRVRIITDDEQVDVPGSQIWKFRKEGVAVRTDNSSFFMHHKFVIIDSEILINGSFNWTRQAITGNQENLMIMNQAQIVQQYGQEFNQLWTDFDPRRLYQPNDDYTAVTGVTSKHYQ